MTSIGETLRGERLRRGWKLEQVAAQTKIRSYFLEAMEQGRFDRLPPGLLARSFLRQYAGTLGLDENEIIASYKEQFEKPPDPLPEPPPKRRSWHLLHPPEFVWVLVAVLACGGIYRLRQDKQRASRELDFGIVASQRASTPGASNSTPAHPPEAAFPSAGVSSRQSIGVLRAPGQAFASQLGPVPDGARAVHVAFTASEPVWLSIKADGAQTYCGVLGEQQSKEFDASSKMTVLIGNAGGIEIALNGRPVGPIGAHGQVLLLVLTPRGASVVPRTQTVPSVVSTEESEQEL